MCFHLKNALPSTSFYLFVIPTVFNVFAKQNLKINASYNLLLSIYLNKFRHILAKSDVNVQSVGGNREGESSIVTAPGDIRIDVPGGRNHASNMDSSGAMSIHVDRESGMTR